MKSNLFLLVFIQLLTINLYCQIPTLNKQLDSTKFLTRDWYLNGYNDKELQVNEVVSFDTMHIKPNDTDPNFEKWTFTKKGELFFEETRDDIGPENDPDKSVFIVKYDPLKWKLERNKENELILVLPKKYPTKYKVLKLTASNLKLMLIEQKKPKCSIDESK